MSKKDIEPKDKRGRLHGYQQWYWTNGELKFRGKLIHYVEIGYQEWHNNIGVIKDSETNFYIR